MQFYVVPPDIVQKYQGSLNEAGMGLFFRQDNQNRWVVNIEVAQDWPGIAWNDFETVTLSFEDFPQDEQIIN